MAPNLPRQAAEVGVDPDVQHLQGDAVLPGEHVRGGTALDHRGDHRPRDLAGVGRDTGVGHPVVTREHGEPDPVERTRRAGALAGGDPGSGVLQPPQSPEGLGERGQPFPGRRAGGGRGRGDHVPTS